MAASSTAAMMGQTQSCLSSRMFFVTAERARLRALTANALREAVERLGSRMSALIARQPRSWDVARTL